MTKKDSPLSNDPDDWLQVFYEEAWRQYVHENELVQTRNAFFLSIVTALLWS